MIMVDRQALSAARRAHAYRALAALEGHERLVEVACDPVRPLDISCMIVLLRLPLGDLLAPEAPEARELLRAFRPAAVRAHRVLGIPRDDQNLPRYL